MKQARTTLPQRLVTQFGLKGLTPEEFFENPRIYKGKNNTEARPRIMSLKLESQAKDYGLCQTSYETGYWVEYLSRWKLVSREGRNDGLLEFIIKYVIFYSGV